MMSLENIHKVIDSNLITTNIPKKKIKLSNFFKKSFVKVLKLIKKVLKFIVIILKKLKYIFNPL